MRPLLSQACGLRIQLTITVFSYDPAVDRAGLAPGHVVEGPAIVEEYTGTTLVPPGMTATVRRGGHLWIA